MSASNSQWSLGLTGQASACAAVPSKVRNDRGRQLQASLACGGWVGPGPEAAPSKQREKFRPERLSQTPHAEIYTKAKRSMAPAQICFPK